MRLVRFEWGGRRVGLMGAEMGGFMDGGWGRQGDGGEGGGRSGGGDLGLLLVLGRVE